MRRPLFASSSLTVPGLFIRCLRAQCYKATSSMLSTYALKPARTDSFPAFTPLLANCSRTIRKLFADNMNTSANCETAISLLATANNVRSVSSKNFLVLNHKHQTNKPEKTASELVASCSIVDSLSVGACLQFFCIRIENH